MARQQTLSPTHVSIASMMRSLCGKMARCLIHHRFTLPKFFFGFRSAKGPFGIRVSIRNRANRMSG